MNDESIARSRWIETAMAQKFIYQPPDDSKPAELVGKMMVGGGIFVGALAVMIYLYETVIGWYNGIVAWALEVWTYLASFWPFCDT